MVKPRAGRAINRISNKEQAGSEMSESWLSHPSVGGTQQKQAEGQNGVSFLHTREVLVQGTSPGWMDLLEEGPGESGGPIPGLGALYWTVPHCSALLLPFAAPSLLKNLHFAVIIDSKEVAKQSVLHVPIARFPQCLQLSTRKRILVRRVCLVLSCYHIRSSLRPPSPVPLNLKKKNSCGILTNSVWTDSLVLS